ncbi:hypothetical protein Axi01nite_36890 [Actinoplanes xinjiangensis]|nr:hypothetical protein Axi01nite_36890 [Actinoplanes xinjiangensis]
MQGQPGHCGEDRPEGVGDPCRVSAFEDRQGDMRMVVAVGAAAERGDAVSVESGPDPSHQPVGVLVEEQFDRMGHGGLRDDGDRWVHGDARPAGTPAGTGSPIRGGRRGQYP